MRDRSFMFLENDAKHIVRLLMRELMITYVLMFSAVSAPRENFTEQLYISIIVETLVNLKNYTESTEKSCKLAFFSVFFVFKQNCADSKSANRIIFNTFVASTNHYPKPK